MKSYQCIILSLSLFVIFVSSIIFFLTFCSFVQEWRSEKARESIRVTLTDLHDFADWGCEVVDKNRCHRITDLNIANLFGLNFYQHQSFDSNDYDPQKCNFVIVIQNFCAKSSHSANADPFKQAKFIIVKLKNK